MVAEGVTRFSYELTRSSPPRDREVAALQRWRRELFTRDSIGCDLSRYGACYGNVSVRTGTWAAGPGRREFVVSCTQTGGQPEPGPECLCRVLRYDHRANHVVAIGPCAPSSETLTHGAMYDASLEVRAIVHGHDPTLWRWLQSQGAPATPPDVDYGTIEMAESAREVVRRSWTAPWAHPGVLSMDGHEDGVIAWGASMAEATRRYLAVWTASRGEPE